MLKKSVEQAGFSVLHFNTPVRKIVLLDIIREKTHDLVLSGVVPVCMQSWTGIQP